jgi:phage tail sheath gpL-like
MTIADQKTPGRPVEISFAAELGLPSANQELLIIGHVLLANTNFNQVVTIANVADPVAAKTEAEAAFGVGSEISKMIVAAVNSNALSGRSNFPAIKAIGLEDDETGFGTADAALVAAQGVKAEFIVSPYDAKDATTRGKLKDHCALVSGAQRVENNQFGTMGVAANHDVTAPGSLTSADTEYLILGYLRDSDTTPPQSVGEVAAALAAAIAGNPVPFNPVNGFVLGGVTAPALQSDWLKVGAGLESETVLEEGWTPLRVKPNGDVAIVRAVTTRTTTNGTTVATAYYDVADFQVLYFWRKTIWTRQSQPDFTNTKASNAVAQELKSEMIRLAVLFEDQTMFQAVAQLAKQFTVVRSLSDRHRFDVKTPVNVIPGLHVIASTISATTQFDTISI